MKDLLERYNYIEWAFIVVYIIINVIFGFEKLTYFLIGLPFLIIIISIVEAERDSKILNVNNLYKYKYEFKILNITIEDKKLYLPYIRVITKYHTVYENLIYHYSGNVSITHKLSVVKKYIKKHGNNIKYDIFINEAEDFICKSEEDALFIIGKCKNHIDAQWNEHNNKPVSQIDSVTNIHFK